MTFTIILTPKQYKKLYKKLQLASTEFTTITDITPPINTDKVMKFRLTESEKSSIERDINAKKPIGETPAYQKFLVAIFPDKTPRFPYLADYDDAITVASKLSELFGKNVRLPHEKEAIKSMKDNNHLTGYRGASSGEIGNADVYGYAWLSGDARGENAPCAWRNRDGESGTYMNVRRYGHSVIPIFG